MLSSAQNSLSPASRPRKMFLDILIFLLVATICSAIQGTIQSIALTVSIFLDPDYHEIILSAAESGVIDYDALMEYMNSFMEAMPSGIYLVLLASSAIYIPGSIIYCRGIEKRPLLGMGFTKRGLFSEYAIGLLIGAVMISLPAAVCYLTGCVSFSLSASNPIMIALYFLAFILQGMGEEVLFRGYLLTSLSRRHNVWVAIIASSLMFSAFHISNANFNLIAFINITLFGIFAGVFMLKRGSIWAVGAIHTAWNFIQGNVFGFNVSGNPKLDSVLESANANFGVILSGGDFGIEGGLGATVVLLIALLTVLAMPAKKSELDTFDDNCCEQ